MSEGPVNAAIGIITGNLVYVLGTLILTFVYNVTVGDMVTGAFAGTTTGILQAWAMIGGLLVIGDVFVVVGAIFSLAR